MTKIINEKVTWKHLQMAGSKKSRCIGSFTAGILGRILFQFISELIPNLLKDVRYNTSTRSRESRRHRIIVFPSWHHTRNLLHGCIRLDHGLGLDLNPFP